jgi:hypothetical protein
MYFRGVVRGEEEEGRARRNVTRGRLDSRDRTGKKIVSSGWRWRAVRHWNTLPETLRTQTNLATFKRELRVWIKANVTIT